MNKCKRCGHEWESKKPNPSVCARCKSPYWQTKSKETIIKELKTKLKTYENN